MWHTDSEIKILQGAFRKLFLWGVHELVEYCIEDGFATAEDVASNGADHHDFFDRLEDEEKVYVIAEVTRCLTTDEEAPDLCQWRESAVYAVFEAIAAAVEIEIDQCQEDEEFAESEYSHFWRTLLSEAERECREEPEDGGYASIDDSDAEEWTDLATEYFADLILWDRDFLCDTISDRPPHVSAEIKAMHGIVDDYYTTAIPAVTSKVFQESAKTILLALKEIG